MFKKEQSVFYCKKGGITKQFKNEKNKEEFNHSIKHIYKEDKTMLSVLYLLTADKSLWRKTKNYMRSGYIALNRVRIRRISEDGYTLFCCAKDMLYGTEHMTPNDLADKDLISSRVFNIICNAMIIKRYGIRTKRCGEVG